MSNRFAEGVAVFAARLASLLGPDGMRIRKSGNIYRTPVMAFVEGRDLSVVLNYGTQSEWVRNVIAAGSADVVHRGKRYQLTGPRVVSTVSAELPPFMQAMRVRDRSALHGVLLGSTE